MGKFPHPIGSEIEFGANFAVKIKRGFAAAEFMRTAGGAAANDMFAAGISGGMDAPGFGLSCRRLIRAAALIADNQRAFMPCVPCIGSGNCGDR